MLHSNLQLRWELINNNVVPKSLNPTAIAPFVFILETIRVLFEQCPTPEIENTDKLQVIFCLGQSEPSLGNSLDKNHINSRRTNMARCWTPSATEWNSTCLQGQRHLWSFDSQALNPFLKRHKSMIIPGYLRAPLGHTG